MKRSSGSRGSTFSFYSLYSKLPSGAVFFYPSLCLPLFSHQFCFPNCILTLHLFICPNTYLISSSLSAVCPRDQPVANLLPLHYAVFLGVPCHPLRESCLLTCWEQSTLQNGVVRLGVNPRANGPQGSPLLGPYA